MSNTPRTDELYAGHDPEYQGDYAPLIEHARQLERELHEARSVCSVEGVQEAMALLIEQRVYATELTKAAFDFACHCTAVLLPHEEQALDRLKAVLAKKTTPAVEGVA